MPSPVIVAFGKPRSPMLILHIQQSVLHQAILLEERPFGILESLFDSEFRFHFNLQWASAVRYPNNPALSLTQIPLFATSIEPLAERCWNRRARRVAHSKSLSFQRSRPE